ncbi:MAG: N-acetyl-gamma-glutamyl-phosphate reductase [Myxococcaceae bacterium]
MHRVNSSSVGIVGASGYSGVEATRLLSRHPGVSLKFVTSDRWEKQSVRARLGDIGPGAALTYVSNAQGEAMARDCAVVLLATPAETSLALAPKLVAAGVRVVDLSGAFRLKDASLYPTYYGFTHTAPDWLARAVYGLPEVSREGIAKAQLVANPGCYATTTALGLFPLLRVGLLEEGSLIVDAASGVTGAGRRASEDYSFSEVADDFRAYKILRHQHVPEIQQTLAKAESGQRPLTFTPHLLPVRRGILATAYARLAQGVEPDALLQALSVFAKNEPFLEVVSPDAVSIKSVVGTNRCRVSVVADRAGADPGRVVVLSATDNLLKGAAGQAVQNLNLMLGLPETTGLLHLNGSWP